MSSAAPKSMSIMNAVWPITMLFGGPLWLAFYRARGRAPERGSDDERPERSMRTSVAVGASPAALDAPWAIWWASSP